jgi:hypothetical protein
VPKYDFNWQLAYELETPLKLPAGSKLVVTAHYDNSRNNKSDPEPEKEVHFRGENQSWDEMFTPFIQYTIDGQNLAKPVTAPQPAPKTAEVVGCMEPGAAGTWMLTNASDPVMSNTQATTSEALKATESRPLGKRRYELLGARFFNPGTQKGQKAAVKGAPIKDARENRLNVTSLQFIAGSCS